MQILKPHIELHGKLKELNLDLLPVSTYAARYSAFNPTEHLWSTVSNKLVGAVLPSKLDGECQPPSQQSQLSKETVHQKEKALFENVLTHRKCVDPLEKCKV